MKIEIGKRITEIRKNMNMNKEQFARLIGMSGQYLGTVEKMIDMLVDFANDEATEVYHNNEGPEELNDCHICIAHNYLSKACDLMAYARDNGLTKDSIVLVNIGDDDETCVEDVKILVE